jgi:hypothetical protein
MTVELRKRILTREKEQDFDVENLFQALGITLFWSALPCFSIPFYSLLHKKSTAFKI